MDQSLPRASQCPDLISQSSQVVGQHAHGDPASSFLILLLWLPSVRARCRLMRQGDAAGWRPAAEHEAGFNGQPFSIPTPETLLTAGPLCAPTGPSTARGSMLSPHFRLLPVPGPNTACGSHLSPHFPLLPADSSFQVFAESKTLLFGPLCHASVCVRKIRTHFNNIHREFFSERSTASAQRLDLPGQSSHVFQHSTHGHPSISLPVPSFHRVLPNGGPYDGPPIGSVRSPSEH